MGGGQGGGKGLLQKNANKHVRTEGESQRGAACKEGPMVFGWGGTRDIKKMGECKTKKNPDSN